MLAVGYIPNSQVEGLAGFGRSQTAAVLIEIQTPTTAVHRNLKQFLTAGGVPDGGQALGMGGQGDQRAVRRVGQSLDGRLVANHPLADARGHQGGVNGLLGLVRERRREGLHGEQQAKFGVTVQNASRSGGQLSRPGHQGLLFGSGLLFLGDGLLLKCISGGRCFRFRELSRQLSVRFGLGFSGGGQL